MWLWEEKKAAVMREPLHVRHNSEGSSGGKTIWAQQPPFLLEWCVSVFSMMTDGTWLVCATQHVWMQHIFKWLNKTLVLITSVYTLKWMWVIVHHVCKSYWFEWVYSIESIPFFHWGKDIHTWFTDPHPNKNCASEKEFKWLTWITMCKIAIMCLSRKVILLGRHHRLLKAI